MFWKICYRNFLYRIYLFAFKESKFNPLNLHKRIIHICKIWIWYGNNTDINFLIKSDYHWNLVTGKVRARKPGEPVAVETVLEWILNGPVASKSVDCSSNLNISESHVLFLNSAVPHDFNDLDNKLSNICDLGTLEIAPDEKDICKNF